MDSTKPEIKECKAIYLTLSDVLAQSLIPLTENNGHNTSNMVSPVEKNDHYFFNYDLYIFEFVFYYPLLDLSNVIPADKTIFHYHGITPPELFPDLDPYKHLAKEALSYHHLLDNSKMILVHSIYMKNFLNKTKPSLKDKIEVIPISVSKDFEQVDVTTKEETTIKTLLYVGRLSGNKEVEILLKALAILKKNSKPPVTFKLILAGAFSRTTTDLYIKKLENILIDQDLTNNVEFVSNPNNKELMALYLSADLFVTASIHEGFCIPVAEAMTCHLPCVIADSTATPETAGSGGITFNPSNALDCANAISETLKSKILRRLQINAAQESKRFTQSCATKSLACAIEDFAKSATNHIENGNNLGNDNVNRENDITLHNNVHRYNESQQIKLLSATSSHSFTYCDQKAVDLAKSKNTFQKLYGWLIKIIRRKMTLPLEASIVRKFSMRQSNLNKALLEEINHLKKEVRKLKKHKLK